MSGEQRYEEYPVEWYETEGDYRVFGAGEIDWLPQALRSPDFCGLICEDAEGDEVVSWFFPAWDWGEMDCGRRWIESRPHNEDPDIDRLRPKRIRMAVRNG